MQNFRPGVGERLSLDYETLRAINPKLVYCQASGFGLKGPDARRPALDPLAQARGGLMSVTGEPEAPPTRTFGGMADQVSAYLLAFGIMMALYHRERTGQGQMVDGSLLQGMLAMQAFNITSYLMSGTYAGSPIPRVSRKLTSPIWNHYQCGDGKWVMLSMAQIGRYWPVFREAMREATGDVYGPEHMSVDWMRQNAVELLSLIPKLDEAFSTKPAADWVALFRSHDLLIEVVQDYGEIGADPQVIENGMLDTLEHPSYGPLQMVAAGVNLSATPATIRTPAPEFGQHTEEVLLEAGYSWEEIEGLRNAGVTGAAAGAKDAK
jgi:crotonobetainyl-CoA:carnitine CoA-transferase CaiB-like acyl-CoA transferase